jgi:hypothetical protein
LDEQQRDFDSIVKYIDKYYAKEAASPKPIAKHYVPNKSSGGKHAEWLPHVDKLIMEMLANRTPPTCIQANIYAMAQAIFPDYNIVKEIPSLKHIKNLRTAMYTVAKTLAAYQLGKAKAWRQLHSDETSQRQTSLLNLLMGIVHLKDLLLH